MEKSEFILKNPLFFKREGLRFIFMVILMVSATTTLAQSRNVGEYDVEAAFLSNFGKFVEWPANAFPPPGAPMVIGIYGENPFQGSLADIVHGRTIDGRQIIVQSVSFNGVQNCQLLYISPSEQKNVAAVVRKLNGVSVLTITENVDPAQSGAIINFVTRNHQIRFEINDAAARRARLKISSKLLSLAVKIALNPPTTQTQALLCERSP